MGLGETPVCSICSEEKSSMWYRNENNDVVCLNCHAARKSEQSDEEKKFSLEDTQLAGLQMESSEDIRTGTDICSSQQSDSRCGISQQGSSSDVTENITKDSTPEFETEKESETAKATEKRETRTRKSRKAKQGARANPLKGKGRRHIFKKTVYKAPTSVATPVTSNSLFYDGKYFQIGDIVALTGIEGDTYYAQITGLLTDQYCEKSATLAWLLPTTNSPPPEDTFDPSTYIIGPEECFPRKLEYVDFVCRAPSNYFKDKYSPYPVQDLNQQKNFVWTNMGPVPRPGKVVTL